jgi:SsrA-binding protein
MKIVVQNKKATFNYTILEKMEAGIVLTGDEVKSLRASHGSLVSAFAHFQKGELFLVNCSITPYEKAYIKKKDDADRRRKLLLKKRELMRLLGDISRKGITIVPLKIYFNDRGIAKVELGLAVHKKAVDKKQELKERDIARQTRREMAGRD